MEGGHRPPIDVAAREGGGGTKTQDWLRLTTPGNDLYPAADFDE